MLGYAGGRLIEERQLTRCGGSRRSPATARDGMILGAAVGFGFAAFESAGYAFNALFTSQGLSLLDLVETEVLRGILAPLGHGLWTAILGGALFAAAARRGRLRLTGPVFGWFLVVALLHFLWDATNGIAVWLTLLLTGTESQWMQVELGRVLNVSEAQVHLYTVLNWALLAMDGLVGLLIGWIRWQRTAPVVPARPGRSGA